MSDPLPVLDDLAAESDELDALVAELSDAEWKAATPAEGWAVAHQVAHLAWTDRAALTAVTDPAAFEAHLAEAAARPFTFVDEGAEAGAALPPADLLAGWRADRAALDAALRAAGPGTRVPWYGPPMSVPSMATARLMETWAHGQDVADALGVRREPTARLRHIARLGWRTRDFAYAMNGLTPPGEPFRIELTPPDGKGLWTYGPEDAPQKVTGPALDFCLLVTRRAHRDDLAVRAEGPDADRWLDLAQAFAGPPGTPRAPRGGEA
ncbi:TIGR03084 family protein [Streptomyces sp. CS227]|uniref:TIGR03084 family metal-binding protein n=1 Tax=Streptomyces sp. CS227 TaxID=1982763 RepID=UPI000B414785|nr:TIGR03084 family metal-binding protein [Streptomyces sp. CS227]OWA12929.1 TIGR03084 family protein [Streptomyces sp. CS227]